MARKLEFDRTVRGVEVTVIATDFDSVGGAYGPSTVYATDENGSDFTLTDEEVEQFTIEASQAAFDGAFED